MKTSVVLVLALMASAPALAAVDAAKMTSAVKADVLPIADVVSMVGHWAATDLSGFDKATSIKVFDTKTLYQPADQQKLASAETGKAADLTKLRAAIKADSGLSGWFTANKLDVNRVIAVSDVKDNPQIFLY